MDLGSGIMAAPFDSEVSGEFFQSSQDKSFSGQVYAAGGSYEYAVFAAGAIGTSAVAALGTATTVALGTEITVASTMTQTMTTTVAEHVGMKMIGAGVASGIVTKSAFDLAGAAATSAYVWSTTAGAGAVNTATTYGALALFAGGYYTDQAGIDTGGMGGLSGVELVGPIEAGITVFDLGATTSKVGTMLGNGLMTGLDSFGNPMSSNSAMSSPFVGDANQRNVVQDPTGKHVKP